MTLLVAQIDGSSLGNPGPAGAACIFTDSKGNPVASHNRSLGIRTNNQAEYEALILALTQADARKTPALTVRTDSELLYYQMTGSYKVRNPGIRKLFLKAKRLADRLPSVRLELIPREKNREADRLARAAARRR